MSTQTHTKREKGQALFLSALMVLSVFAMSAAFAGAAAAQSEGEMSELSQTTEEEPVNQDELSDYLFWSGQEITVGGLNDDGTVQLHSVDDGLQQEVNIQNGEVTLDMQDREGYYYLSGGGASGESETFLVAEQSLDAEFNPDSVVENDGETELVFDTIRANYDVEVTTENEDLNLEDIFGESVEETTEDGVVLSNDDTTANFSGVDTGEYDFTIEATDTGAEADASIEVTEEPADDASLDANQYSEEAGDVAEFTVDMENADNAVLTLEDENGDYWADVHIASNGEDEVNVSFNTYNAGQNDGEVVSADGDAEATLVDDRDIENDSHLLPGDYELRLYLTDAGNSEEVTTDNERVDVQNLQWVDAAELELSEGSIGDATPGVAPGDADLDADTPADEVNDATTQGDAVAEGDYFVVDIDASGVFGFLADGEFGDEITFEMEQTNPGTYDAPDELDHTDVEVVEDPENDRLFFILDTDDTVEAGAEYDVTFSVSEDYTYADEDTESTTSFSVVDRSVEVTGDFDDDDRLQVEQDENSTITGESSIAPGSDVQVRLHLGALDPGMESQTVEVQDDGTIEANFDLSDREPDEELEVEIIDDADDENTDRVDAVLVESAADDGDQEPHTVTITVTDADGEPVEDAEVEIDGQTETTDSNGEATFELQHGEYDVSATYDGESASGTVSVGDDSSDTGSLTLGEEDAGEINDPADDTNDENDADDEDDGMDTDDDEDTGADDGTDTDDDDDPEDEEQPGFGIAVALIALLAAAGIAVRNRA